MVELYQFQPFTKIVKYQPLNLVTSEHVTTVWLSGLKTFVRNDKVSQTTTSKLFSDPTNISLLQNLISIFNQSLRIAQLNYEHLILTYP